jgi:hypothetical protein
MWRNPHFVALVEVPNACMDHAWKVLGVSLRRCAALVVNLEA